MLQPLVVDLIDLGLHVKHAHWNVRGALFLPVHEQLDKIYETVLEAVDELAERQITLGYPVDGQSKTVAANSRLSPIRTHFLPSQEVVEEISNRLERVISFLREALDAVGDLDPITQDMLIRNTGALEKHLWMLQSQQL